MQRLRRLLSRRSVRRQDGAFVAEGATLIGVALQVGAEVESVYLAPGAGDAEHAVADSAAGAGARVFELAAGVLGRVADTVTPQPVLAVVRMPVASVAVLRQAALVVVCVDVRDPGNLGTVVRSATASGADAVVCCTGSADPFNPKTVRSSAGTVLQVPLVVDVDAGTVLDLLGAEGIRRVGAVASGGRPHTDVDWTRRSAVVLGNEASGLSDELVDRLDERVTIPMAPAVESLNVSMAATVLCFEVARQRSNLHKMQDDGDRTAAPAVDRT